MDNICSICNSNLIKQLNVHKGCFTTEILKNCNNCAKLRKQSKKDSNLIVQLKNKAINNSIDFKDKKLNISNAIENLSLDDTLSDDSDSDYRVTLLKGDFLGNLMSFNYEGFEEQFEKALLKSVKINGDEHPNLAFYKEILLKLNKKQRMLLFAHINGLIVFYSSFNHKNINFMNLEDCKLNEFDIPKEGISSEIVSLYQLAFMIEI